MVKSVRKSAGRKLPVGQRVYSFFSGLTRVNIWKFLRWQNPQVSAASVQNVSEQIEWIETLFHVFVSFLMFN